MKFEIFTMVVPGSRGCEEPHLIDFIGLGYQQGKDIVFRFIIEYSSSGWIRTHDLFLQSVGAQVSSPPLCYVQKRSPKEEPKANYELLAKQALARAPSPSHRSSSSLSAPELQRSNRRRSKKRIAKSGHNTPPFPSILKLFQLITCPILNLFILNLFICFCCYCFRCKNQPNFCFLV